MKKKSDKSSPVLRAGFYLFFLCLLIGALYFGIKLRSAFSVEKAPLKNETVDIENSSQSGKDLQWSLYRDEEYGFQFEHPKLLKIKRLQDSGRYEKFVRFEENEFSVEKGLALGISKQSLDDESVTIVLELNGDKSRVVGSEITTVAGLEAKRFSFEPDSDGESREVIVIKLKDVSVSISTVPEQMDRIIESFKII